MREMDECHTYFEMECIKQKGGNEKTSRGMKVTSDIACMANATIVISIYDDMYALTAILQNMESIRAMVVRLPGKHERNRITRTLVR